MFNNKRTRSIEYDGNLESHLQQKMHCRSVTLYITLYHTNVFQPNLSVKRSK